VFIAGTNAATTVTTALTTTFTGNLTGSVASVAANGITATSLAADAINAASIKTRAITNAKFAAGAIDAAAIADNAIDAGAIAADAITAAKIAAGAIDNATFAADVGSTAYATNIIALAADKAIVNAALGTAAELAKVPKSDSTVSWNATALAAINAQLVDVVATDVIADSIPAHEARPTIAQALLLITRLLTEKAVSTTTVTINKEDGTTAALTLTLDDATNPTSITRAT
jgi:hypothetical protein